MTDFEEQIRRNLENDWGPAATHSEYKRGNTLKYRVGNETYTGVIVWVVAQGESRVIGHDPLPMHYIVERSGWTGFPDIVWPGDILSSEGDEVVLVFCPYCQGHHFNGGDMYCPRNPNKP
jgi:hypothetical protein